MNAQVNTGSTYSSTESRIKTKKVQTLWKDIHWRSKKWQIFLRLFWTPNIYHWERCLNVAFVYVNGLNLVKFEE